MCQTLRNTAARLFKAETTSTWEKAPVHPSRWYPTDSARRSPSAHRSYYLALGSFPAQCLTEALSYSSEDPHFCLLTRHRDEGAAWLSEYSPSLLRETLFERMHWNASSEWNLKGSWQRDLCQEILAVISSPLTAKPYFCFHSHCGSTTTLPDSILLDAQTPHFSGKPGGTETTPVLQRGKVFL